MTVSLRQRNYTIRLNTNTTQGGVVEMSGQTRKESSLEAMSESWMKSPLLRPCLLSPQITETCLWKLLKPGLLPLTPPAVDPANLRSKARSLEGRWEMLVSLAVF